MPRTQLNAFSSTSILEKLEIIVIYRHIYSRSNSYRISISWGKFYGPFYRRYKSEGKGEGEKVFVSKWEAGES